MSDVDLGLVERAAARGLIPAGALDRARRECRGPAAEWLLDQKLLTQQQLSLLIEDEIPFLPRGAAKDSSWAVLVFMAVIAVAVLFAILFYSYTARPPARYPAPVVLSAHPEIEAARAEAAGDYRMAVIYYSQALANSPRKASLYGARASNFQRVKNVAGALADIEVAVALDPTDTSFHVVRAGILIELGRAQEAVDDLEKLPPSPERDSILETAKAMAGKK